MSRSLSSNTHIPYYRSSLIRKHQCVRSRSIDVINSPLRSGLDRQLHPHSVRPIVLVRRPADALNLRSWSRQGIGLHIDILPKKTAHTQDADLPAIPTHTEQKFKGRCHWRTGSTNHSCSLEALSRHHRTLAWPGSRLTVRHFLSFPIPSMPH